MLIYYRKYIIMSSAFLPYYKHFFVDCSNLSRPIFSSSKGKALKKGHLAMPLYIII